MASWWIINLAGVLLLISGSFGASFECDAGQTEIETPFIYDESANDCPSLLGAPFVDWYNDIYRSECQRWMGGAKPVSIEKAYISECHAYGNGTLRYRAQVCCPGVVENRCFTCTNETNDYDCNYRGIVETCTTGQECGTVFNYYGKNGAYCQRKISKGCMDADVCQTLSDDYSATCKSYVDEPQCGFCYPGESFGNLDSPTYPGNLYCGKDVCSPNPCRNGFCCKNDTMEKGYYCDCYPWSFPNEEGVCMQTYCNLNPCKNGATCLSRSNDAGYQCCCKAGFDGQNCTEVVQSSCPSNPDYCQNGGTCTEYKSGNLRCTCPEGYVGTQCEKDVSGVECSSYEYSYSHQTYSTSLTCSSYAGPHSPSFSIQYMCAPRMKRADGPLFENGVHGDVNDVEYTGLSSCDPADTCLAFTQRVCCPSCLSAPCLNGGWCLQKSDDDYVCKCRYGYGGRNCEHSM